MGGCNERSGSGDGDAVSSVLSKTSTGTGVGLSLWSDSGATVGSKVRGRLLALLPLTE
jgi:hypothetical protein